jgi:hypothetical protein
MLELGSRSSAIEDVCDGHARVGKVPFGTWLVARSHADTVLSAMQERFGLGRTVVITDAAQQRKCGPSCQEGKPENALVPVRRRETRGRVGIGGPCLSATSMGTTARPHVGEAQPSENPPRATEMRPQSQVVDRT